MTVIVTHTFPTYYEDPASVSWDAEKMTQILDLLGLDSRNAESLISLSIADREIIVERFRSDVAGVPCVTRNVIRLQ